MQISQVGLHAEAVKFIKKENKKWIESVLFDFDIDLIRAALKNIAQSLSEVMLLKRLYYISVEFEIKRKFFNICRPAEHKFRQIWRFASDVLQCWLDKQL